MFSAQVLGKLRPLCGNGANLAAIVNLLRESPVQEHITRSDIDEHALERIRFMECSVTLDLEEGGDFEWIFLKPARPCVLLDCIYGACKLAS